MSVCSVADAPSVTVNVPVVCLQLYTIHVIESSSGDKTPAIITRRYSDFQRLHATLRRNYGDVMERVCFPRQYRFLTDLKSMISTCAAQHSGVLFSWLQVKGCTGTSQRKRSPSGAVRLSSICLTCVPCQPWGRYCASASFSTLPTCRRDSC